MRTLQDVCPLILHITDKSREKSYNTCTISQLHYSKNLRIYIANLILHKYSPSDTSINSTLRCLYGYLYL